MAPDIVPTSPQGIALQGAIQHKLADLGWSTEDDSVMAEYCLVMLGNRKTPDQISTELSDLIGTDFDRSFVDWLFDEVKRQYPEPAAPPPAPSASSSLSSSSAAPAPRNGAAQPDRNGIPSRPAAPLGGGGRQVFGAAVSGMKRGARDVEDGAASGGERQQQRARYDGPAGGRNNNSSRSLFDRVNGNNPQFAPGRSSGPVNNTGMPQPAFDAITKAVNSILHAGAHPSVLANIPFPALAAHPLSSRLPPQVMAQAQANAAMQAQAFAAMQNVWNTPPAAFGPPGGPAAGPGIFNPNAPAFQPGGFRAGAGAGGRPPHGPGLGPQQQRHGRAAVPVVLPTKPTQDSICKHGVDCARPQCPYSHPSPVATKESGLVLSSEACEKQLKCEDKDCPKAHVSKAQLTHPPSAVSSGTAAQVPPRPSPAAAAAVSSTATESVPLSGAGEKPCKFGAACTRPNCVFVHPWDVRGDPSAQVNCRYGAACTRADCHFKHPAHRPAPYNRHKFSATFNSKNAAAGSPSPATAGSGSASTGSKAGDSGAIAPKPSESAEHISERLKRFSAGGAGGAAAGGGQGEVERIVPGQQQVKPTTTTTTTSANTANGGTPAHEGGKVEIPLDEDEEKKVQAK
ncbi:hypothetical protein JCM3774_001980 [Rhodotorula dairenensis]